MTTTGLAGLTGWPRADGRVGFRNHLLVLPSVVCASQAARAVAGADELAIIHQHGCLQVGDDLVHTRSELLGAAVNPNVGAVVVMSLGCETLNGRRLADEIAGRGQRVELVGIQASGGTEAAVAAGRRAAARLRVELNGRGREPVASGRLSVGLDAGPDDPLRDVLVPALQSEGMTVLVLEDGGGPEAHVALAEAGAQLIVSLPAENEAPIGFATCPVLAVGRACDLHRALAAEFDVATRSGESVTSLAAQVAAAALTHADGVATAAERRGARDFVLHRLAMTM